MKKLLFLGGVCSILLTLTFVSCKKEVVPKKEVLGESEKQEMTSDGRMLIFNSSSTYESLVSNPDEKAQKEFLMKISKMNHITYAEKNEKETSIDLIDDEYFSSIINEDGIVQIGDYLYRINAVSEKVFVLPASHISEYSDLVCENKANKNIRQFSTGDCVIELAESGDAGEKSLFCGEDGCGSDVQNTLGFSYAGFIGAGKVRYLSLGVYFCLKAEAESNSNYVRIYLNIENAWDKVKCGTAHGATSYPWYQNNSTYSVQQEFRKYYGIQPLNGMHIKARVRCEIPTTAGYETVFTNWGVIRANSPY